MKPITSDCETSLRQENEELCISKQVLEKKIEELKKKSMEKEMFNVLEGNMLEIYSEDEKRKEMDYLNEIAVQKFSRGNK